MPPTEQVPPRVGYSDGPYERTSRQYVTVNHMCLQDGHSINGNYQLDPDMLLQVKSCLAGYNRQFRLDNVISDSTTIESGVGPVIANFKEQNLFERWERMLSRDPKVHKNLRLFEWNQIGLLYRKRTAAEINAALKKRAGETPTREDGDSPDISDPVTLQFEFVAVYASLYSLICGVKAWACRKISGHVQVTADNMYNCLKGVPNMYWFNAAVMDAKNIAFPTVNALQLGRAAPRNEVNVFFPVCCVLKAFNSYFLFS